MGRRCRCADSYSERIAGGGIYEVESLTGVRERDLYDEADDSLHGFTYVGLKLVEPWFGAEVRPVARISGGPGARGATQGWFISLRVGQRVGLLLMGATPKNRDHIGLDSRGVFAERAEDSFSNGQFFTKEAVDARELTALMKEVADDPECNVNRLPDL